MTTMTAPAATLTGGVDTHADLHVAAALDDVGRLLGTASFPTTSAIGSCTAGSQASA
jgi:hypothetical protein